MKITKRQLRRIISEWRQNPAKIRQARRQRDRDRMIDTMTFNQLKTKAFDSALGIQGRLDTGQYEYEDVWEVEIPRLADYIDAAKVKAAEEGVTYDDIPEVRHNGGILDLSKYSLGGLPAGIKESKMEITEQQLRSIIKEMLLIEQGEEISNSDFAKQLKGGAADIASAVPAKMNDDLARVIKALTAMAQYDKSKFEKMVGYADDLGASALEKAEKGDKGEG